MSIVIGILTGLLIIMWVSFSISIRDIRVELRAEKDKKVALSIESADRITRVFNHYDEKLKEIDRNIELHKRAIACFEEETQAVTKRHKEREEIKTRFTRQPR
jgi:hypothetical protein